MLATIMKTLEYPLAVTCFSKKQCDKLLQPILKAGLSGSGVMNTMARAVVHGPHSHQGLAIKSLYTEQGI
jgi:hypothetical protein